MSRKLKSSCFLRSEIPGIVLAFQIQIVVLTIFVYVSWWFLLKFDWSRGHLVYLSAFGTRVLVPTSTTAGASLEAAWTRSVTVARQHFTVEVDHWMILDETKCLNAKALLRIDGIRVIQSGIQATSAIQSRKWVWIRDIRIVQQEISYFTCKRMKVAVN